MALKTDSVFHDRDVSNVFVLNSPATRGTLLTRDSTDTATVGQGDCNYGNVVAGSISVTGDREYGVLLYDVTSTGPTFENVVVGQLDYSTKAGQPCAIWEVRGGMMFSTDQYQTAAGSGQIIAGQVNGNTPADTFLGIKNGLYVKASDFTAGQAGSVPRAKLIGNAVIDGNQAIRVRVLS